MQSFLFLITTIYHCAKTRQRIIVLSNSALYYRLNSTILLFHLRTFILKKRDDFHCYRDAVVQIILYNQNVSSLFQIILLSRVQVGVQRKQRLNRKHFVTTPRFMHRSSSVIVDQLAHSTILILIHRLSTGFVLLSIFNEICIMNERPI